MSDKRPASEGKSLIRAVAAGAMQAVAKYITATYLIPVGAAVMTGAVGRLQGLPWMYVFLGAGLMFVLVTGALVLLDFLRERRRVAGKLTLVGVAGSKNVVGEGYVLEIAVLNNASFPVEVDVVERRSKLGNRVPVLSSFEKSGTIIPPRHFGWFSDHAIDIGDPPMPGALTGLVEARIRYGRPGSLKHELTIRQQVTLLFNAQGILTGTGHNDAP